MPFALIIIGIWFLVAGVRNTQGPGAGMLFTLIQGDFTGQDNFIFWLIAILLIGALGYIQKLKPVSTAFLILILMVLFLKKGNASGVGGGFFQQFLTGIQSGTSSSTSGSSLENELQTLQNEVNATTGGSNQLNTSLSPAQQNQSIQQQILNSLNQNLNNDPEFSNP